MENTLYDFTPGKPLVSRDLKEIQLRVGGQAGTISVGQEKVVALRLAENVFVATEKVPPVVQQSMRLERVDLHQVVKRADLVQFLQRWRAFGQTEES